MRVKMFKHDRWYWGYAIIALLALALAVALIFCPV
jgi:hypothetical protein